MSQTTKRGLPKVPKNSPVKTHSAVSTEPAAAPSHEQTKEPVSAPAPAPSTKPAPESQQHTANGEENGTREKKHSRSKYVGLAIPVARIMKTMDKMFLNAESKNLSNQYKTQLKKYVVAREALVTGTCKEKNETKNESGTVVKTEVDVPLTEEQRKEFTKIVSEIEPVYADIEKKIQALSRERTRISQHAAHLLAIVYNLLLKQLVDHSVDNCIKEQKNIVHRNHVHDGIESLPLFKLIHYLPSYLEMRHLIETENASAAKIAASRRSYTQGWDNALSEFRTTYEKELATLKLKKRFPIDAAARENAVRQDIDAHDEEPAEKDINSFKFHVAIACKELKDASNPEASKIRFHGGTKNYFTSLLMDLTAKISTSIRSVISISGVKTVNENIVLKILESMLNENCQVTERFEFVEQQVDDAKAALAERIKRKQALADNQPYVKQAVPQQTIYIANKTITYVGSFYPPLCKEIQEKKSLLVPNAGDKK